MRADGDQRHALGGERRPELPVIIGKGDVAGRAAGEAEEDEHRRPLRDKLVERQRPALGIEQGEAVHPVAHPDRLGRIELRDELPPLLDVPGKLFGIPCAHALGVQGFELGCQAFGLGRSGSSIILLQGRRDDRWSGGAPTNEIGQPSVNGCLYGADQRSRTTSAAGSSRRPAACPGSPFLRMI